MLMRVRMGVAQSLIFLNGLIFLELGLDLCMCFIDLLAKTNPATTS